MNEGVDCENEGVDCDTVNWLVNTQFVALLTVCTSSDLSTTADSKKVAVNGTP